MARSLCACTLFVFLLIIFNSGMSRCSESSKENRTINATDTNVIQDEKAENEISIRQRWKDQEKSLKSLVNGMIKRSMPTLMREIYSRNVSSSCMGSLLQLASALKQTKLWAFKMLDASGKFPIGFLTGTMTTLGNYEECLDINIDHRKTKIQGQYCLVDITPPLPKWRPFMSLHLPVPELKNISAPDSVITFISQFAHNLYIASIKAGVCIPSSCSKDDADKLIQILPHVMNLNWKFSINRCETKESFQFSSTQVAIMCIFAFVGFLVIIGTLVDFVMAEESITEWKDVKGKMYHVIQCFSLRINMKSISTYRAPEKHLGFIYGITYITMIWIIAANAFMSINYDTAANVMDAIRMTRNMWYEIMMNRITPMQSLFFFSAFSVTYNWMRSTDHSIWNYLLKAYLRYTPTYMFLIALLMLTPGWGSGPSWMNYLSSTYTNCKRNWWTNLLYINNYVNSEEMCLENSWFFAVAAQLHVLGLVILIPLKRFPKIGLLLNLFLLVASLLTVFLTNMYYNILPNETMTFSNRRDIMYYAIRSYHRLYSHSVFYCAGILVGYFTATRSTMKISRRLSFSLWILTSIGAILTVCIVHAWSDGNLPNPFICAGYAALGKLLWAAFLSWLTVSCVIEQKGVFYDIMSWKPFAFLHRLIFIVLVINPTIVTMILSFKKVHLFISDIEIYYNLASLIVCNYLLAYVIHVAVESPLLRLTSWLNKADGIKTLNNTTTAIAHQFEGVLTEKLPKVRTHSNTTEKKCLEKSIEGTNCCNPV